MRSKIYPSFAEKKFTTPKNEVKQFKPNLNVLEGQEKDFLKGAEIAYETILTSLPKETPKN